MSPAEALAQLPDATRVSLVIGSGDLTVGDIRVAMSTGTAYITTEEASKRFGWTPETWARYAAEVPGSLKDRVWHLPMDAAEDYFKSRNRNRKRRRGPWKTAQAPRVRPQTGTEG